MPLALPTSMTQPCVPWEVAEAAAYQVASLGGASFRVVGEPSGRVASVCRDAHDADHPLVERDAGEVEVLVWVTEPQAPAAVTRLGLLDALTGVTGHVVFLEAVEPGCGLGIELLKRIDPGLARFETDELPAGEGRTRHRSPWEAPARWVVAHATAWRFGADAEEARAGLRTRLPRMSPPEMILACRRLLQRFEHAHEVFALAAEELSRRGEVKGVDQISAAADIVQSMPIGMRARLRRARVAALGPTRAEQGPSPAPLAVRSGG